MTGELRQRILEQYNDHNKDHVTPDQVRLREMHALIAEKLWVKRKLVAEVLREVTQAGNNLTPETKTRAIEMYQRFVENGHRPEGGRRRAISSAFGVPYKQVMNLIREWSLAEYGKSPTPSPTRQQLFEVEKMYWDEMTRQRFRLTEIPAKIAEQLGFVTRWQVLRWLDVLHDDERAFSNVPNPPPDVEQGIIDAYLEYLSLPSPPDHGLHYTIAAKVPHVTPRQVHKVLQTYRHQKRADYPMI